MLVSWSPASTPQNSDLTHLSSPCHKQQVSRVNKALRVQERKQVIAYLLKWTAENSWINNSSRETNTQYRTPQLPSQSPSDGVPPLPVLDTPLRRDLTPSPRQALCRDSFRLYQTDFRRGGWSRARIWEVGPSGRFRLAARQRSASS